MMLIAYDGSAAARRAQAELAGRAVEVTPIAAPGDPLTEILAAADERDAHIIVVGGSGTKGHLLHGSLTSRLVRRATQDVLVVH